MLKSLNIFGLMIVFVSRQAGRQAGRFMYID